MTEIALTRAPHDRRRFELAGVGSIRKGPVWWSGWRKAELVTRDGEVLWTAVHGMAGKTTDAVDAQGRTVGSSQTGLFSSASAVRWRSLRYELTKDRLMAKRYMLAREGRPLVRLRLVFPTRRAPVHVTVEDAEVDPGLVLFAAWLLQQQNVAAASSSGGGG